MTAKVKVNDCELEDMATENQKPMTPILNFMIHRVNSGAKVMVAEVRGKKYAHDIITMIDGERKRKVSPLLWAKLGKLMELESTTLGIKIYKVRQ